MGPTNSRRLVRALLLAAAALPRANPGHVQRYTPNLADEGIRTTVSVLSSRDTLWPCCSCGDVQFFWNTVNTGKDGRFGLQVDCAAVPADLLTVPLRICAEQTVALGRTTAAVTEAAALAAYSGEQLRSPGWGPLPTSFVVENGGALSLSAITVLGRVDLQAGSVSLHLSGVTL